MIVLVLILRLVGSFVLTVAGDFWTAPGWGGVFHEFRRPGPWLSRDPL